MSRDLCCDSVVFLLPSALAILLFFFFNDTATTEIYTLSLHDALPIYQDLREVATLDQEQDLAHPLAVVRHVEGGVVGVVRSEEHTSELQSRLHLVCRLLLEKKKRKELGY